MRSNKADALITSHSYKLQLRVVPAPVCCTEREYSHALNLAQRISVPNLARPESRSSNLGRESRTCESILHSQKVDLALRGNVAIEGFWCYYQRKNGRKDAWSLLLCRISLGLDLGRGISHALNLAQRISVPNLARPESRLPNLGPESRTPFRISLRTTNRFYA